MEHYNIVRKKYKNGLKVNLGADFWMHVSGDQEVQILIHVTFHYGEHSNQKFTNPKPSTLEELKENIEREFKEFEKNVNSTNYLDCFKKYLWPMNSRLNDDIRYYFQQDGARAHRAK